MNKILPEESTNLLPTKLTLTKPLEIRSNLPPAPKALSKQTIS